MAGTVLLAPDKFKGSMSAPDVAYHLATGIARVSPSATTLQLPVADGGDGFRAAAQAAGYRPVPVSTVGPTGAPVETVYAVSDGVAVVELAEASGLTRLPGGRLEPLRASSYGTGLVVRAALEAGCHTVLLGLGGSACTDGGAGLLEALGARYTLDDGTPWDRRAGVALSRLGEVDLRGVTSAVQGARIVLASDVDNPLLGPSGAAAVYGPQKGADSEQIALLDHGLARWADLVERATGAVWRHQPGAGAAGGVGFGAMAALDARSQSGIDVVLDMVGFDSAIQEVRLVVTGEGALDDQTLRGKAVAGVAARARAASVPVLAVAGRCDLTVDALQAAGIVATHVLSDIESDLQVCLDKPGPLLERIGERIAATWPSR
ncbi:glycerate kinase [Pseudonocardia nematodicida]|uniref:Glycerate kinase n=1 Tax=Pseudonocardia nematodicida TaxID=1206997 RepID=A0ABV1KJ44_9PSEU